MVDSYELETVFFTLENFYLEIPPPFLGAVCCKGTRPPLRDSKERQKKKKKTKKQKKNNREEKRAREKRSW